MKKIAFVLCILSLCTSFGLSAKESTVWTGNEPISWNTDVYAGTQFETPSGIFAGLQKDHIIKVAVVPGIDEPQYVMTYKAGESWTWTDLAITIKDSILSYTVESAQIATEIADRGLIFRGQGYNITSIIVDDLLPDSVPPVDPQPTDSMDLTGLVETVLWTGNAAISWNSEEYAGDKLDTRSISETMFAGLQENDIICVTFAEAAEDAQFGLQYKAGDNWSWTDLNYQLSAINSQLLYRVASDEMAMLIADRGLVVTGIKYHATKISRFTSQTEGVEQVQRNNVQGTKVFENGVLYLKYKGTKYNVQGIRVE